MRATSSLLRPSTVRAAARQLCQHEAPVTKFRTVRVLPRQARRPFSSSPKFRNQQPGDNPEFTSILDNPPVLVRSGRKHGPGLIILALIPITAFALGTWQIFRLKWKTELLAKCEDRIVRSPLPLPPRVDPSSVAEFDYRRVYTTGTFRHDLEMLVGPRVREGENGYMVITPLVPTPPAGSDPNEEPPPPVLVNRGFIAKKFRRQEDRAPEALPTGEVRVEGMIRKPWKKNMFTPDNRPDKGEFYFPDVAEMASLTGSQPVWIEETMEPEWFQVLEMQSKGIPIGRAAEVNIRNNHAQYIFTWYGLAFATSIMFYMVVKKPPSDVTRRVVRMNKHW